MGVADGRVVGASKIVDHGSDTLRWVVALPSEGYRENELATYALDASAFVEHLQQTSPFDKLWNAVNIYRVDVSSTESGAADPIACGGTGLIPKTYFDASFCHASNTARILGVNANTAL